MIKSQADVVVEVAQKEVGRNAGGKKFWSWYGFKDRVSWCACFYSWCMDQAGLKCADLRQHPKDYAEQDGQALISKGCVQILDWSEKHGRRIGEELARPGDVILYEWDPHDDPGDGVDHVGIIEWVEGDTPDDQIIHTIEGNWRDNVTRRTVEYRDTTVWAIIRPAYATLEVPDVPNFELSKGAKGQAVMIVQCILANAGYSLGKDGIDGEFGKDTESAVKAFQKDNDLEADGEIGPKTWAELLA